MAFQPGDLVRLKNGTKPIKVTKTHPSCNAISGYYLSSTREYPIVRRRAEDFTLVTKKVSKTMSALYALVSDPTIMGTIIARNQTNKAVFEERTAPHTIHLLDDAELTKVVPYTVQLGQHHFAAPVGMLTKGDLLINPTGDVMRVNAVDTQVEDARSMDISKLRRVVTEPLQ